MDSGLRRNDDVTRYKYKKNCTKKVKIAISEIFLYFQVIFLYKKNTYLIYRKYS